MPLIFQVLDFHHLWCRIQLLPLYESTPMKHTSFSSHNPNPTTWDWFRLVPFRSPLLRESLLLSFPPATKMFQFTGFSLLLP